MTLREQAVARALKIFTTTEGPTPLFNALADAEERALLLREALELYVAACPSDPDATERFQRASGQAHAVLQATR